jgi:hypothetical protein
MYVGFSYASMPRWGRRGLAEPLITVAQLVISIIRRFRGVEILYNSKNLVQRPDFHVTH